MVNKKENSTNEKYFTNWLTLKYSNRDLADEYEDFKKWTKPKKALIFSVGLLIYSISNVVFQILYKEEIEGEDVSSMSAEEISEREMLLKRSECVFPMTCVSLGVGIVTVIISLMRIRFRALTEWTHFFIFLQCGMTSGNLREIFHALSDSLKSSTASSEVLIKCVYITIGECSYMPILLSTGVNLVSRWVMGRIIDISVPSLSMNTAVNLAMVLLAYVMEKKGKMLFYYKWKVSKKNEWLKSTLDNIQNGLVIIDKHRLHYCNDYVCNTLPFLLENEEEDEEYARRREKTPSVKIPHDQAKHLKKSLTFTTSPILVNNEYFYCEAPTRREFDKLYLNRYILRNLENLNPELSCEVIESINNPNNLLNEILPVIEADNRVHHSFRDFKFLGTKNFENCENNPNNSILEIFIRVVEKEDNKIAFEFIFNDVTRSKVTEEAKAQIKYKSLFMAKVAHEFKNPLIIIKELVDQILEELPHNLQKNSKVMDNLILSKNLSSYLFILVKDFEVISKKENSTRIELSKNPLNIREEMDFLKQVVESLIAKKYGESSQSPIKFILEIDTNVPEVIYTDNMRLLQILINLLSNSIKFTHTGEICLKLELNSNNSNDIVNKLDNNLDSNNSSRSKIRFTVKDEGVGIPEQEVANLFKNFYKTNDNNPYGSGLGLGIARELCVLLGGNIEFSHNEPNGCIFTFGIDYENDQQEEVSPINLEEDQKVSSNNKISRIGDITFLSNISENSSRQLKFVSRKRVSQTQKFTIHNVNLNDETLSMLKRVSVQTTPATRKNSKDIINSNIPYRKINLSECVENRNKQMKIEEEEEEGVLISSNIKDSSAILQSFKEILPKLPPNIKANFALPELNFQKDDSMISEPSEYSSHRELLLNHCKENPHNNSNHSSKNDVTINTINNLNNQGTINFGPTQISNIVVVNNTPYSDFKRKAFNSAEFKTSNFDHNIISNNEVLVNLNQQLKRKIITYKSSNNNNTLNLNSYSRPKSFSKNKLVVLIADDETFIRKSIIRQLDNFINSLKTNLELQIIETSDGVETLYAVYHSILQGATIDLIISDETMKYMPGSQFSLILSKVFGDKIPVAIVSAYEGNVNQANYTSSAICGVFTKPVSVEKFSSIFQSAKISFV